MSNYKKNESFTLIELLVVIVIIGVIAGLITIGVSSFVATSQNTKMVAQLSSLGTALETYGTYHQGNLCLEDNNNNSNFLSYYGLQTVPSNPSYDGLTAGNQTITGTNNCLLYFSDGQNYSIRTPAPGNKGYLIQESRYMKTQDIKTSCESGWIPFGNRCIMQYEAKAKSGSSIITCPATGCSTSSHTAVSQADGIPWRYVTQDEAKEACQNIGAHLMTNAEWMALARDIADVDSNWIGGKGVGYLKTGNTGEDTSGAYNSALDPDYGTSRNEKAKLILSNGEEIWDLSGNMWEWVDETKQTSELPNYSSTWREFNAINYTSNLPYSEVGPANRALTSVNRVGQIYTDNNNAYCSSTGTDCSPTHAFRRGGYWDYTSYAGVFALILDTSPENRNYNVGFRCAR
ncbi:MAG: SUMF1/EgtB/PvdO family nonheme iron enzyme [Candidatus Pacebacteria bacterium]|nr:SUMF1/EgtB/PvdO family nonheme iron enzyme [Candidatus Paceibacterota bacterium]